MSRRCAVLAVSWVAAAACGGGDDGVPAIADARPSTHDAAASIDADADAGADAAGFPDATPVNCTVEPNAFLGHCRLSGSDTPCAGVPGEDRIFVAIEPGEEIAMVIGPQGAAMFVLAVRTSGIYPGDATNPASDDNPNVDIMLHDPIGEQVGRYLGRPIFQEYPSDTTLLDAAGLFVVVERSAIPSGTRLTATVDVTDRDEVWRCGHVEFIATN